MIFGEREEDEEEEPSLAELGDGVSGFGAMGLYLDMISAVFAGLLLVQGFKVLIMVWLLSGFTSPDLLLAKARNQMVRSEDPMDRKMENEAWHNGGCWGRL